MIESASGNKAFLSRKDDSSVPCVSSSSFWFPEYISPSGWLEHAPFAFWLIDEAKPKKMVELGSHYGFSFFAFCQAIKRLRLPTVCYAVDTWVGDDHAGFYGEAVFNHVQSIQSTHYAQFSHLVRSTFDDASNKVADGSVDLLHIDGRHAYDDALHDFTTWLPKVSDQGIVLFHDTRVYERGFGVFRLWDELQKRYPNFEFHHGNGLGVIAVGKSMTPGIEILFNASQEQQRSIRDVYARLGASISQAHQLHVTTESLKIREKELAQILVAVRELTEKLNPKKLVP